MIPVSRLVARASPARRRQVAAIKTRLAAARRRGSTESMRQAATRVAELRDELVRAAGCAGSTCGDCARGMSAPEGVYAGGRCCSGPADNVFPPTEIDVLATLGVRPRDLGSAPRAADAGCAFRGPTGCSLPTRARPTICLHYVCGELMGELADRGVARQVGVVRENLTKAMVTFARLAEEHRLDVEFAATFGRIRP